MALNTQRSTIIILQNPDSVYRGEIGLVMKILVLYLHIIIYKYTLNNYNIGFVCLSS